MAFNKSNNSQPGKIRIRSYSKLSLVIKTAE